MWHAACIRGADYLLDDSGLGMLSVAAYFEVKSTVQRRRDQRPHNIPTDLFKSTLKCTRLFNML